MARKTIESYDGYIDDLMENCTYNSYKKLQTVGPFSISDKVKIKVDWAPELCRNKCKILSFRKYANKNFAEIKWDNSSLYKKYGSLFSLDELVRI